MTVSRNQLEGFGQISKDKQFNSKYYDKILVVLANPKKWALWR